MFQVRKQPKAYETVAYRAGNWNGIPADCDTIEEAQSIVERYGICNGMGWDIFDSETGKRIVDINKPFFLREDATPLELYVCSYNTLRQELEDCEKHGQEDSPRADALRDAMDPLWYKMTPDEIAQFREYVRNRWHD